MKIAILAGGYSRERDVSLSSGYSAAESLCRGGHLVKVIDPYLGICLPQGTDDYQDHFSYTHQIPLSPPNLFLLWEATKRRAAPLSPELPRLLAGADAVFLALHGGCGENGQLQAYLDMQGIPYTGAGYAASALCIDKWRTKLLLQAAGVPVPVGVCLPAGSAACELPFPYPCVCKPRAGGSSFGLKILSTREEFSKALADNGQEDLLIEEKIPGREFSVGILNGKILPAVELKPQENYDFHAKYQPGATQEICPAPLTFAEWECLQALSKKAAAALDVSILARIDFRMDARGDFRCLEANTLPGLTPTSLLPRQAQSAGIDMEELCRRILSSSVRLREEERLRFFCGN